MVRIKTKQKTQPKKNRPTTRPDRAAQWIAQRMRVLVALVVVVLLGWGTHGVWHYYAPQISQRSNYLLSDQRITISILPEWITGDVRTEAVRNAGLAGRLSILDEAFPQVIEDAFALHPWVQSVDRITKNYPAGVHVELTYRRPVAVVELVHQNVVQLVPIDRNGVHLPASEVPNIRKRYLPRIGNILERPPEGQPWTDPRVLGAAELATQLEQVWESLHLVDILPSARPEVRAGYRYFVFDFITRGGTRIVWGAAPGATPPGEDEFTVKLERLRSYEQHNGLLDKTFGPKVVNVRTELAVQPRTAKKRHRPRTAKNRPRTAKKPHGGSKEEPVVK